MIVELTSGDNMESIEKMIGMAMEKALTEECDCHCVFSTFEMPYALAKSIGIDGIPICISENCAEFLLSNGSVLSVQTIGNMNAFVERKRADGCRRTRFMFMHMLKLYRYEQAIADEILSPLLFKEIHVVYNVDIEDVEQSVHCVISQNHADFSRIHPEASTYDIYTLSDLLMFMLYNDKMDRRKSEIVEYDEGTQSLCTKCNKVGGDLYGCVGMPSKNCLLFGDNLVVGEGCPYFAEIMMHNFNQTDGNHGDDF